MADDPRIEAAAKAIWTTWARSEGLMDTWELMLQAHAVGADKFPKLTPMVDLCREEARAAIAAADAAAFRELPGFVSEELAIDRLIAAVEGECDGLAIDHAQARSIYFYMLTGEEAPTPERVS